MKIQYEEGDQVYLSAKYGQIPYTVTAVRTKGLVLTDRFGETLFAGKNQIEPTPATTQKATWIN